MCHCLWLFKLLTVNRRVSTGSRNGTAQWWTETAFSRWWACDSHSYDMTVWHACVQTQQHKLTGSSFFLLGCESSSSDSPALISCHNKIIISRNKVPHVEYRIIELSVILNKCVGPQLPYGIHCNLPCFVWASLALQILHHSVK